MGTENVELMKMARESLKGNWGLAIGTFLLYMFIMGFLQGMADYYPMPETKMPNCNKYLMASITLVQL